MKTLTITLLAVVFCVTLTGLNPKEDTVSKKENVSSTTQIDYNFTLNRHVKKGREIPTNG